MRVFLSAGHHPRAKGASAVDINPPRRVHEYDLAVDITAELARRLRLVEPMLVPTGPLSEKIAFVNRWSRPGDIAVEIHLNSYHNPQPTVHGAEVFYPGPDAKRAKEIARALLRSLVEEAGRKNRGVRVPRDSARGFLAWVARVKAHPVLVEVDFLSNVRARDWLLRGDGISISAKVLAAAIDRLP